MMATFIGPRNHIFGTRFCTFDTIVKQNCCPEKEPEPFCPVATKYCELKDETICIEQPAIAALQRIKIQLPTRSGSAYKSISLYEIFKQFSGPRKVLKTQWKTHFWEGGFKLGAFG